jgi:hypothetical protein
MKKINFLLVIGFILFSAFSCEKEDVTPDPVDEGLITLSELNGSWDFVSYTYNGTEYDCSSDLSGVEYINQCFTDITFNTSTMGVQRINACYDHTVELDFTKDTNIIKFDRLGDIWDEVYYVFTVLSYDGVELKLRVDQTSFNYDYLGGTLTLIK